MHKGMHLQAAKPMYSTFTDATSSNVTSTSSTSPTISVKNKAMVATSIDPSNSTAKAIPPFGVAIICKVGPFSAASVFGYSNKGAPSSATTSSVATVNNTPTKAA